MRFHLYALNSPSLFHTSFRSIAMFQPSRDVSGAALALFTASLHNPQAATHKTTLQGVVYQLDIALQSPDTQRNGIIFIYDMSGSKYSNFDYELSQKILTMLKVSNCSLNKCIVCMRRAWLLSHFISLEVTFRPGKMLSETLRSQAKPKRCCSDKNFAFSIKRKLCRKTFKVCVSDVCGWMERNNRNE